MRKLKRHISRPLGTIALQRVLPMEHRDAAIYASPIPECVTQPLFHIARAQRRSRMPIRISAVASIVQREESLVIRPVSINGAICMDTAPYLPIRLARSSIAIRQCNCKKSEGKLSFAMWLSIRTAAIPPSTILLRVGLEAWEGVT